jgi:hypothetical protein
MLKVKGLKLALTFDERVETVLHSGRHGWTQRQVADEVNARHPERNPITQKQDLSLTSLELVAIL